jgi:hypothetical protein
MVASPLVPDAATSSERDVDPEASNNDVIDSGTRSRKVVRRQKLDGKELAAEDLALRLRQRKFRKKRSAYWDLLSVDIISCEETVGSELQKFDRVVVRCMTCDVKHDAASINVPNFANTHFTVDGGVYTCKRAKGRGAKHTYMLRRLVAVHAHQASTLVYLQTSSSKRLLALAGKMLKQLSHNLRLTSNARLTRLKNLPCISIPLIPRHSV